MQYMLKNWKSPIGHDRIGHLQFAFRFEIVVLVAALGLARAIKSLGCLCNLRKRQNQRKNWTKTPQKCRDTAKQFLPLCERIYDTTGRLGIVSSCFRHLFLPNFWGCAHGRTSASGPGVRD